MTDTQESSVEGTQAPETQEAPPTVRDVVEQSIRDSIETSVNEQTGELEFTVGQLEEAAEQELSPEEQKKREWAKDVLEKEGDSPPEHQETEGKTIPIERYKELQSWATRVNQAVKTLDDQNKYLRGRVDQLSSGEQSEEQGLDLIDVFSDEKRGVEFIGEMVTQIVQPAFAKMDERLQIAEAKLSVSDEYVEAINKYGEDFNENILGVKQVLDMHPDSTMTFSEAYEKFLELRKSFGEQPGNGVTRTSDTPEGQDTQPASTRRIPAEQARRAAEKFRRDDSVGGEPGAEPARIPKTAREAATLAVEQLAQRSL